MWSGVLHIEPVTLQHGTTYVIVGIAVLYFGYLLLFAGLSGVEAHRRAHPAVRRLRGVLVGLQQAGSSFGLFAERFTDRHIGGFEVPAAWFQSLNALDIVIFALPFAALVLARPAQARPVRAAEVHAEPHRHGARLPGDRRRRRVRRAVASQHELADRGLVHLGRAVPEPGGAVGVHQARAQALRRRNLGVWFTARRWAS
ncbi:MAG: hypothetical protein U1F30_10630 [Steroidobacteraceae bacterium]